LIFLGAAFIILGLTSPELNLLCHIYVTERYINNVSKL
jgi:hypothetical protein